MEETNSRFLPKVEDMLRAVGWYPGRVIEQSQLNQWYAIKWSQDNGYCAIFPAALRILKEFGGLDFKDNLRYLKPSFRFNPLDILQIPGLSRDWMIYEWATAAHLFPLGMCSTDKDINILAVATDGKILYISPENAGILEVANSFDAALNVLTSQQELDEDPFNYDFAVDFERTSKAIKSVMAGESRQDAQSKQ